MTKENNELMTNNAAVAKVVTVAKNGRHTVELDSGKQIMVFSATGEHYNPGDTVSMMYLSGGRI